LKAGGLGSSQKDLMNGSLVASTLLGSVFIFIQVTRYITLRLDRSPPMSSAFVVGLCCCRSDWVLAKQLPLVLFTDAVCADFSMKECLSSRCQAREICQSCLDEHSKVSHAFSPLQGGVSHS
jgi:hypothetical protein